LEPKSGTEILHFCASQPNSCGQRNPQPVEQFLRCRPILNQSRQPLRQGQPSAARERGGSYRSPSRVGKRAAVAWLEPEAVKQLNMIAIQRDMQVQHILVEAINDWFARNGLPRFDA
jgi:hypothetical protein